MVWLLNTLTSEYSWVDRVWSIIPILYGANYLHHQKECTGVPIAERPYLMLGLVTVWGARLTYNYFRKGGYAKGGEDYRWVYIRQKYPRIVVELLTFFFTSFYQIYLIMWFSTPVHYAHSGPLNTNDYALTALWLLLFIGEVVADQQQWNYQTEKYRLRALHAKEPKKIPALYQRGFLKEGLFRYSRHPNFFCEISLWYTIYLFSVNSIGWNLSGVGAVLLNLLFLGSTNLTEQISTEKYPAYTTYQKETNMLIPLPASTAKEQ